MITAIKMIIRQLRADKGINVIQANGKGVQPSLPFGVYNITSPYINGTGREITEYISDTEGIKQRKIEEYRATLSFTFYADTNEEVIELAFLVREWFAFYGEEFLNKENVVVADIGNITDRTTFLVDSYEYKHGFDVQLRLTDEQIKSIDYFNQVGG